MKLSEMLPAGKEEEKARQVALRVEKLKRQCAAKLNAAEGEVAEFNEQLRSAYIQGSFDAILAQTMNVQDAERRVTALKTIESVVTA